MTPLNGPHCKGVWWIHDGRLHTTTCGHGFFFSFFSTLASSLWTSSVWVRSGLLQALLGEVRRQSVTYRTWLLAIEQVYVFGVWTEMQPEYSQLRLRRSIYFALTTGGTGFAVCCACWRPTEFGIAQLGRLGGSFCHFCRRALERPSFSVALQHQHNKWQ